MADPLFWLVRSDNGTRSIYLPHAQDKLYAWLRSALAGHVGAPVE